MLRKSTARKAPRNTAKHRSNSDKAFGLVQWALPRLTPELINEALVRESVADNQVLANAVEGSMFEQILDELLKSCPKDKRYAAIANAIFRLGLSGGLRAMDLLVVR